MASADDKLWKWLRQIYPPENETYDWVVVIPPLRAHGKTDWRLFNQKAVRIVKIVEDEAIIEAKHGGQRCRMLVRYLFARCDCEWSMALRGCECGAIQRDKDVNDIIQGNLPED